MVRPTGGSLYGSGRAAVGCGSPAFLSYGGRPTVSVHRPLGGSRPARSSGISASSPPTPPRCGGPRTATVAAMGTCVIPRPAQSTVDGIRDRKYTMCKDFRRRYAGVRTGAHRVDFGHSARRPRLAATTVHVAPISAGRAFRDGFPRRMAVPHAVGHAVSRPPEVAGAARFARRRTTLLGPVRLSDVYCSAAHGAGASVRPCAAQPHTPVQAEKPFVQSQERCFSLVFGLLGE